MKINRLVPLCFILISFFSGCKTTRIIQSGKQVTLPGANYNSVFFRIDSKTDFRNKGFDSLAAAIETAHKNNLKIYAVIDIARLAGAEPTSSLPQVITRMKNTIHNLIADYNIDGLSLLPGNTSPDLIEELVVEAMLVKPYLINSLVYSGANEYKNAAWCLEKILPEQVIGLDLSALFPDNPGGQTVYINNRSKTKITDSEGHIGFILSDPDTIVLESRGQISNPFY